MISQGRHKARGVMGALGTTGTGKEQIAVLLEVTEGEAQGSQITWYGYFTEKTIDRTMESLRLLGWSTDDLSDLTGIDANDVTIVVEHETDLDGEPRARVKWINGGGGLGLKEPMNGVAAKMFAERMKGAALASRKKAGNGSKPAAPRGPSPDELNKAFTEDPPF